MVLDFLMKVGMLRLPVEIMLSLACVRLTVHA